MNTRALILALVVVLAACGGGDDDQTDDPPQPSTMPCKYRPDCTAGPPVGSTPEPPLPPASAASA